MVEGCAGLKVMDVSQCRNLEGSVWGRNPSMDGSVASVNGDVPMVGIQPQSPATGGFLGDLSDGGRVKFVSVADGKFRGGSA